MMARSLPRATACVVTCLLVAALTACGESEEPVDIDIKVFPARMDENPGDPVPAGWRRVEFSGSHRSRAGTFLVAEETLLTGWSITAMRVAEETDGSRAISFRLNAAAKKRLAEFCVDEANLKMPLGLSIDGRWAGFSPLLRAPGDRMSLYGFTAEEAERTERWLRIR